MTDGVDNNDTGVTEYALVAYRIADRIDNIIASFVGMGRGEKTLPRGDDLRTFLSPVEYRGDLGLTTHDVPEGVVHTMNIQVGDLILMVFDNYDHTPDGIGRMHRAIITGIQVGKGKVLPMTHKLVGNHNTLWDSYTRFVDTLVWPLIEGH